MFEMGERYTPTPWGFDRMGRSTVSTTNISSADGRFVCGTGGHSDNRKSDNGVGENEANAAFIVLAVNSYASQASRIEELEKAGADLVDVLLEFRDTGDVAMGRINAARRKMEAAISKAEPSHE